jgi:hypothetical protein
VTITEVIFRVWHPLAMIRERYVSDLIFRHRKPLLVVEWDKNRATAVIVVQLERRHLHPINLPRVQYIYDREIDVLDAGL